MSTNLSADPGFTDQMGRSPLHYATRAGDVSQVRELLRAGADPKTGDRDGFTPLHFAAQEHHLDVATELIEYGVEIDAPNKHGNTPLFVAVFNSRGRGDMISLLIANGADATRKNWFGQSPVALAQLIGNYGVVGHLADSR